MNFDVPPYPEELRDLPGRELARLSQTNVTMDNLSGKEYGFAAFDKGLIEAETDPTLASEAAAKVGFRYALDQDQPNVDEWFRRAHLLLPDTPAGQREAIANHLLQGRALGFLALHAEDPNARHSLFTRATVAFNVSQKLLKEQHQAGSSWDAYATMSSRHQATIEAVKPGGKAVTAAKIALSGIDQALRSRFETANTPDIALANKVLGHAKFVGKQVVMNTVALGLAVTKPITRLETKRQALAASLLG